MRRIVEALEWLFRHLVSYPFLRLLFHNEYSDQPLDIRAVKRILILRFDRIGDMIVTTPIFRILKKHNPALHIGVFTSQGNAEIISQNKNVDAVYVLHRNWWKMWKEIRKARRMEYDVVLNFIFNRTTSAGVLANLVAPRGFKVGQGDDKYQFFFNRLLKLQRAESHMVEVLVGYIEAVFKFSVHEDDTQLEIVIPHEIRSQVDKFLKRHQLVRRDTRPDGSSHYLVMNISAADRDREMEERQAVGLIRHLLSTTPYQIVLIGAPSAEMQLNGIVQQVQSERCLSFVGEKTAPLLQVASLIEGAQAVITPDTSIIHFASAMKTPVLGFFVTIDKRYEWAPYNVQYDVLLSPNGKPISEFPLSEMCTAADNFLRSLKNP